MILSWTEEAWEDYLGSGLGESLKNTDSSIARKVGPSKLLGAGTTTN